MLRLHVPIAFAALVLMHAGDARAGTIYDTTASWNGSSNIGFFAANPATQTYGQTFVAGADNIIDDFTFYMKGVGFQHTVKFTANIFAWNGNLIGGNLLHGAVGASLFTSGVIDFVDNGSFQAVTINTGGIALSSGSNYVAFFTTTNVVQSNINAYDPFLFGRSGFHSANNGQGGFVFQNNSSFNDLSVIAWDSSAIDYGDLAWTANFSSGSSASAVPEPASMITLAAGAIGMLGFRMRKRKADAGLVA